MSGAVYSLLAGDPVLSDLGVEAVETDYSLEVRPLDGKFIILRWGAQSISRGIYHGPVTLTLWAHQPREVGTDYTQLDDILVRCRYLLTEMEQVTGTDARRIVEASFQGNGANLIDPGFRTICKNSTYRVLLGMV